MFYTKPLDVHADRDIPEFDPIGILRELNYFPFLHGRNKATIAEALRDRKWIGAFCDMSAAATTQLYYRGMIDLERVWTNVAAFFHQAIQMRGFDPVPSPRDELGGPEAARTRVEILVAGTQAPEIYRARVDAALEILRQVAPPRSRITFSGANPYKSNLQMGLQCGVRTLNEAADMELYFRQQVRKHGVPATVDFTIQRETESETTRKNLENFFDRVRDELSNSERTHVYVVSSLYHLPRFVDLTTEMIRAGDLKVSQLSFVSAEDPLEGLPDAVTCSDYIKSCMFEFYYQLYSNTPPEQICQVGRV